MKKLPKEMYVTRHCNATNEWIVASAILEDAIDDSDNDVKVGVYELKCVKTVSALKTLVSAIVVVLVAGCGGFKKVAQTIPGDEPITFTKDTRGHVVSATIPGEHHIVLTQGVIDGVTVDQDHAQTLQHCKARYTSEEMAAIRAVSPSHDHSWYKGCTLLTAPILAKDSSKVEKVAGIAMAGAVAFGLHQVGRGLGKSGDQVTQQGGNAEQNNNSGNTSIRRDTITNTNSGNKNVVK